MSKVYTKLLLTLIAFVVSLVMVVSVSYAWMTLSNNPVAEGIQITIGGGNTILVAADLEREHGGTVYHYPGAFDDTLNFVQNASYAYLSEYSGLTPVSTADGVNWFIPTYYDLTDAAVQNGTVLSGSMKSLNEFVRDDTLQYANLSERETKKASQGSYLYLDFWVVSPGADYTLRVSTGEDSGGSFVIGLPAAAENPEGGYSLSPDGNTSEACVRVGLLANPGYITDETMWYYQSSPGYSAQYTRLRGNYPQPGERSDNSSAYRFTIYEPNADLHPTVDSAQGSYLVTRPVGLVDGTVTPVDVGSSLTVQTQSNWAQAQVGEGTQLEQRFTTATFDPSFSGLSADEMTRKFYNEYLQAQVSPYVTKGLFVKNTENLYNAAGTSGVADAAFLGQEYTATATDDVYIVKLEKNVPQRIRMFIWLEGQDADCVNRAEASSFAFRIELAGSHDDDGETQPDTAVNPVQQEASLSGNDPVQQEDYVQQEDPVVQEDLMQQEDPAVQEDSAAQEELSDAEGSDGEEPLTGTEEDAGALEEEQSDTLSETELEHEE